MEAGDAIEQLLRLGRIPRALPRLRGLEQQLRTVDGWGQLRGLGERGRGLGQLARVAHEAGEQEERVLGGLGGHRRTGQPRRAGLVSGLLRRERGLVEEPGTLRPLDHLGASGEHGGAGERVVGALEERDQELERVGVARARAAARGERLEQPAGLLGLAALEEQSRQLDLQPGGLLALRRLRDEAPEHGDQRLELTAATMGVRERAEGDHVPGIGLVGPLDQREGARIVVEHVGRDLGGLHQEGGGTWPTGGLGRPLEEGEQILVTETARSPATARSTTDVSEGRSSASGSSASSASAGSSTSAAARR